MPSTDTGELIRAARGGNPAAFDDLTGRFRGPVLAFLAVRLADAAAVEDLVQETFLTAYRGLDGFRQEAPFLPWLQGIALNLLRNALRKKRPQVVDPLSERLEAAAQREVEALGDSDVVEALERCVAGLDERSARLVTMHYREGRPLEQIAGADGSSAKAVSMALVRIRRRLKECIQGRLKEVSG